MTQKPDIILRKHYDRPYRFAVWQRCCEIALKKDLDRERFFLIEIDPILLSNRSRIKADFDSNFKFEWSAGDYFRIISDFISSGDTRRFGLKAFHMFDAYVQIVTPKFLTLLSGKDDLDKMGEIVGYFLRDPNVGELDYLLAQAKQKLLHFFSYDNVDSLGTYDETVRYLCLFVGESPDYLFAIDFAHIHGDIAPLYDEQLRLYYGFCAPGEEFSPLIMRSYCLKERLAGLLYAKSAIIDLSSPTLDKLTFDVFTTDKSFYGMAGGISSSESQKNQLIQKARQMVKGARVQRNLTKIEEQTDIYKSLNTRVKQVVLELL